MKSFGLVEDKVYESDFFLDKIKYSINPIECKYYFSAFLSSSRSITFALQSSMNGIKGFQEWYETKQEELRKSSLSKKFVELRNESQKVGICRIGSGSFYTDSKGRNRTKLYFENEYNFYSRGQSPKQVLLKGLFNGKLFQHDEDDVASQSEQYFLFLLKVIHECFSKFKEVIDPDKYYTLENINNLHLSIEDIEEELGYPRGYTKVEGITDEKRMELLREEVTLSRIDSIFEKYLSIKRYED